MRWTIQFEFSKLVERQTLMLIDCIVWYNSFITIHDQCGQICRSFCSWAIFLSFRYLNEGFFSRYAIGYIFIVCKLPNIENKQLDTLFRLWLCNITKCKRTFCSKFCISRTILKWKEAVSYYQLTLTMHLYFCVRMLLARTFTG